MRHRFFSDFCAIVDRRDWEAAVAGDVSAARRIAGALDGVDLYFHGGPHIEGDVIGVTLADLLCHGIIPRVTLRKDE